jgi:hypothetical protein
MFRKLLCWLGMHGPNYCGNADDEQSFRTNAFERTCLHCGAVWHGSERYYPATRGTDCWRRIK